MAGLCDVLKSERKRNSKDEDHEHQYRSGSLLDSLDILFNDYTYYPGLRTADPSNITLLEVLRNLQPRNSFKRRYETIFRIQV